VKNLSGNIFLRLSIEMVAMSAGQKKRVVILGAGFAGLFAALQFEKLHKMVPGLEVTLVDRNNYHMFVPLLYHVGTGGIEPGNICFPIRSTLKNGGSSLPVLFRECEVLNLDIEKRIVVTDRVQLPYDYLIFALGSTTNFYGIPGLEQNIVPLKTIKDGMVMHNRIIENFEEALLENDEQKRHNLITFVIVGGGATGVELASTMSLFIHKSLAHDFPTVVNEARIVLIEASGSLLHGMRPEIGRLALRRLQKLQIEVMLNCRVASADPEGIITNDGRSILSRNVVWVGGIKPSPLAEALKVEKARDGRIIVDPYLAVPVIPELHIIGDSTYALKPDGTAYPPTAQTAIQMGIYTAGNIVRTLKGYPLYPFNYKYKGDLVFLGRNYAVGEFFGRIISGRVAFLIYQSYHLITLAGFKNKIITLIDWAYDYFYRRDTSKLESLTSITSPKRTDAPK
jgi:NADH dehydrogenase